VHFVRQNYQGHGTNVSKQESRHIPGNGDRILRSIEKIVRYWLEGDFNRIGSYLDDNVVMYLPHLDYRIAGKKEGVRALRQLRLYSDIRRYCGEDVTVESNGDIAIAHSRYSLEYIRGVQRMTESGMDLFVLKRRNRTWRIVRWSMIANETMPCATDEDQQPAEKGQVPADL